MMILLRILCLVIVAYAPAWSSESSEAETPYQTGLRGLQSYRDGKYSEAVPLLQEALTKGELSFALTYADICRRDLDGGKHTLSEAAEWYVAAANAGDGDALSYLHTLPTVREDEDFDTRVSELRKLWIGDVANRGFTLYKSGEYSEAAKHLKRAALENHPLAQELYADICRRELDGKPHPLKEAAMYYLLSAQGGDPQSHSYLRSIMPTIFNIPDPNAQMDVIVRKWVYDVTVGKLTPIKPKVINEFLVWKFGRDINKTTSQKLPYFFDKFVNALMCRVGSAPQQFVEEDADDMPEAEPPQKIPAGQSCAIEFEQREGRHFVNQRAQCYTFGPVYFNYFQSLDSINGGFIPKPPKCPPISIVYQFVLGALQESTKYMNANQLTDLSHREYPWLLGGLKVWRVKHPRMAWTINRYSEEDLLRILTDFTEVIPEDITASLLRLIENETIWQDMKDDAIAVEFDENIRKFFACPLSTGCQFVQKMQGHFFDSLRSHTLDLKVQSNLETLKTPLLMYHCEILVLTNVSSTEGCYNALSQAQRYFSHLLRLDIRLTDTFNKNSAFGKRIIHIIHKITTRGFTVNQD